MSRFTPASAAEMAARGLSPDGTTAKKAATAPTPTAKPIAKAGLDTSQRIAAVVTALKQEREA